MDLNNVTEPTKNWIIKGYLLYEANKVLTNGTIDERINVDAA